MKTMNYFTTSFNPSGNRYVDACDSPPISSSTKSVGRTRRMMSYSFEDVSSEIEWIVGSNSISSEFVIVSRNKEQRRIVFDIGNANTTNDASSANDDNSQNKTFQPVEFTTRPLIVNGTTPIQPIVSPSITSQFSSAIPTPDGGHLFVSQAQQLVQLSFQGNDVTSTELQKAVVDALLDAHITYSYKNERWAILNRATTNRYVHSILGDGVEAYELHILKWNSTTNLIQVDMSITLPDTEEDLVYEQLAPIWADINEDGIDDIVTTVSGYGLGAQLRVYILEKTKEDDMNNDTISYSLQRTVTSNWIGIGNRWLHQLGIGPLGPHGEVEIVEIRTPHIGGQVRYYQYVPTNDETEEAHSLVLVGQTSYYSTHDIGSRNIDMITIVDLNGDSIPEIVVEDQESNYIVGLQRSSNNENAIEEVWKVPTGNGRRLSSNIGITCYTSQYYVNTTTMTTENNNNHGTTEPVIATGIDLLVGFTTKEMLRISFTPSFVDNDDLPASGNVPHVGTRASSRIGDDIPILSSFIMTYLLWTIMF